MTFQAINHENTERPEGIACLLIFGYQPEEIDKIKEYLATIAEIPLIVIEPDTVQTLIKDFVHNEVVKHTVSEPITEHAILFNAVSEFELNQFVHNYRSLQLPRPLFAMVTPTSREWSFQTLVKDLQEERAMFEKMRNQK